MDTINSSTDSVITLPHHTAPPLPVYDKSIFQAHQLQPTDFQVNQIHKSQPDWILAVLMFCFIILAWIQVFYHSRIQQIFRAPFSKRFLNQLTRDGNLFKERIVVALGIIYLLTFSLLVYEFNEKILGLTFHDIGGLTLFGLIALVTVAGLAAKVALVQFLGVIFRTRETSKSYVLNMMIFALLSGPVLLASLVLIVYLKSIILLYISLAIFILLFVFRFSRGFIIGMSLRKFSYLFLFVYLCSLEILPLLILIKFLINHTNTAGA